MTTLWAFARAKKQPVAASALIENIKECFLVLIGVHAGSIAIITPSILPADISRPLLRPGVNVQA